MSTTDTSQRTDEPTKQPPRVPGRRRRWVWVAASALVVGAIVGNAALIAQLADRQPMLVLTRDVAWGQQLSSEDVTTVDLPADVGAFAVPEANRGAVLGRVAGHTLRAGHLLASGDLTRQVVPGPGQRVVGLRLEPGRYPAGGLAPNDPVAVHTAPDDTSSSAATADQSGPSGAEFSARVVRASPPDADGAITADLLIPEATGPAAVDAAVTGAQVSLLGPDER